MLRKDCKVSVVVTKFTHIVASVEVVEVEPDVPVVGFRG